MTNVLEIAKLFLSNELENKIIEYLNKLKNSKFSSMLSSDFHSKCISFESFSIISLEHLKSLWLEIANLSVNLYIDYDFFRQFSFASRYKSQIYEESLKKLGYKQNEEIWKSYEKPNEQIVIENVFYSCIFQFLHQEKQQELDNEKFSEQNVENSNRLDNLRTGQFPINEQMMRTPADIIDLSGCCDNNIIDGKCGVCNSEIIDGKCCVCGEDSNLLTNMQTSILKINKSNGDQSKQIRTTSSTNHNIDSDSADKIVFCNFCDNEIINGKCSTCDNNSNTLINMQTSIQNSNKNDGDQLKQIRSTSSKIATNQNIDSYSSSHWTCNVCSYQNNESNINCEACVPGKFAEVNTCASNENDSNSLEHDEHSFNQSSSTNAENKDKWRCEHCTFNNEISASLCAAAYLH